MTTLDPTTWKFDEPGFYLNEPVPAYHWLLENDPVRWYEEGQFYVVTKHADLRQATSNPATFSSVNVGVIADLIQRRKEGVSLGVTTAEGEEVKRGIMFMDPPEHAKHRKLIAPRMTPKAVEALGASVQKIATDLADALPLGEPVDFMEAIAEPFPVWVFADILGVPKDDWAQVVHWSTTIAAAGSGENIDNYIDELLNEVAPYLIALLEDRAANPRDDLLSLVAHATIDGVPYDIMEQVTMAVVLLAAGSETTQSLLAGMAQSLMMNPDEQKRLVADQSLLAGTVEETLRWWTPVRSMAREVVQPTELSGTRLSPGDGILLLFSAGNRDPEFWGPDPDRFDIGRPDASRHLGFGFGEHFCLGVHLARREARAMFEEILRRVSWIEPAGEPTPRSSALINGFDSLPVVLTPR